MKSDSSLGGAAGRPFRRAVDVCPTVRGIPIKFHLAGRYACCTTSIVTGLLFLGFVVAATVSCSGSGDSPTAPPPNRTLAGQFVLGQLSADPTPAIQEALLELDGQKIASCDPTSGNPPDANVP